MKKSELIDLISSATDTPKKTVEAILDQLSVEITSELKRGGDVTLVGVGKLEVTQRAQREGRNPQTGEAITISARRAPKFKAAKQLKDALA